MTLVNSDKRESWDWVVFVVGWRWQALASLFFRSLLLLVWCACVPFGFRVSFFLLSPGSLRESLPSVCFMDAFLL